MSPLSIISATPPSINPGMVLSDAASAAFVATNGFEARHWRLVPLDERLAPLDDATLREAIIRGCDVGIPYGTLSGPEDLDGTIPLFWGDFLHESLYRGVLAILYPARGDLIRDALLLHGAFARHAGGHATFGTTFLHNRTRDYDAGYAEDLYRFIRTAGALQLRDVHSAAIAQSLRPETESCLGIDAVQLLHLPAYRERVLGSATPPQRDGVGVFFARYRHEPEPLCALVAGLAAAVGGRTRWLDWGDRLSFPFGAALREAFATEPPSLVHPVDLARQVASSALIVTDTYHCAVTAWALGVPAVMVLGEPHGEEIAVDPLHFLTRIDKRATFFHQAGLNDFVVPPRLAARPEHVTAYTARLAADWLGDGAARLGPLIDRLAGFAARCEQRLATRLRQRAG